MKVFLVITIMIQIYKVDSYSISEIQSLAIQIWPVVYKTILENHQMEYMLQLIYSEEALKKQMLNNQDFYLIKYRNTSIGFMSLEHNYNKEATTKLHKLYLLPELQKKGFGRFLIEKAKELTLDNNNNTILLNVNRFNNAKYFYEKLGFIVVLEEKIEIGNGYIMDDFQMKLYI